MDDREYIIRTLVADPILAHATFFKEGHADHTPQFHKTIIQDWHSSIPNILDLAFRGAAKSTLAEEAITVMAALGETKNCIIIGESYERAVDRLRAIKHHIETNAFIQATLGVEPGPIWTEDKIVLNNNTIIQAFGRGQSLRGVKYLDWRPDMAFYDDLEDKESVATPEARAKTMQWFTATAMPALDVKRRRQRMAATPLHPEALAVRLSHNPGWLTRIFPVIYRADDGGWLATWPERFPVEWALQEQQVMESLGRGEDFVQEYLCQASDPASQTFTDNMFRVVPRERSWHPVYVAYDPARTTNKSSATTGKVVCSWIGNKLVVWEASARKLMPDEIIKDIFETDEKYSPIVIGFEENGLNEWALQPIRSEQLVKGMVLPLRPLHAPKGKFDFIRGLQPYFKSGEVEFVQDFPELRTQLLGFPTGHIDAPNALAYMLRMRLGVPIYDGLSDEHVISKVSLVKNNPINVAVNTDGRTTTAQLIQYTSRRLLVLRDWLLEGDPGECLPEIVREVRMETDNAQGIRWFSPRTHFQDFSVIGLKAAANKARVTVNRGGDPLVGREEIRSLMKRFSRELPAFMVSSKARWTLRAMAGGFCKDATAAEPMDNSYAVLMTGLESLVGLMRGPETQDDNSASYVYTSDGRRYISALGR